MENIGAILFLYAESPLHAGSGTGLGAVDLPVQRERMSHLPMIQGSGIKGALRERLFPEDDDDDLDLWRALFGPRPPGADQGDAANEHAGALSLVDGHLLLFPVRTVWGGWAWITAPIVLERLARDLALLGLESQVIADAAKRAIATGGEGAGEADDRVFVSTKSTIARDGHLLIEDLDYEAVPDTAVDDLAEWLRAHAIPDSSGYKPFADRLSGQISVVSDGELRFLAEHATEVVTRTRIDPNTGTVAKGALWTEENLPAETMLWSTTLFRAGRLPKREGAERRRDFAADTLRARFVKALSGVPRIRLGGDHAVGRGLVGVRVHAEDGGGT